MYELRLFLRTARWVLAWFVAFVTVASVAPWVQAHPLQDVCYATGGEHSSQQDPAVHHAAGHLECALCAGVTAPPPAPVALAVVQDPVAHAVRPLVSAALASLTSAPLPARGPPHFS